MADINILKYHRGDSDLHTTHPTLKIITMILICYPLIYGRDLLLLYYIPVLIISLYRSKIKINRGEIKYLIYIFTTVTFFQVVLNKSFKVDYILSGLFYSIKITILILTGTIFSGTTRPEDITPGIYLIIRNKKIAENLSLTIRLIPFFLIGWKEIELNLKSRGLYLSKNPFRKIKYTAIPLLVETINRADKISTAMDARSYNGWIYCKPIDNKFSLKIIIIALLPYLSLIKKL